MEGISGQADSKPLGRELPVEQYWYYIATDQMLDRKEDDRGYITGFEPAVHGPTPVYIHKDNSHDLVARNRGYVRAVFFYIRVSYDHGDDPETTTLPHRKRAFKRLKKLTGMSFRTKQEWTEWYKENKPYFEYSEKLDQVVVTGKPR